MDSIKAKKLQAMKNYKDSQFLSNLILRSLIALLCILFCSYPFWFPHLCSSLNHFVFVSLPNLKSFFFNPKCLFFVCNAIIAFLVRESKLESSCSSPASDIYDMYVESSRSIREASIPMEKKNEGKPEMNFIAACVNKIEEKCVVQKEKGEEKVTDDDNNDDEYFEDCHDHDNKEVGERDEEEEPGLPTEELNKRVENFIAKVNKQRWLEARLVDSERG